MFKNECLFFVNEDMKMKLIAKQISDQTKRFKP